MVLYIIQKLFSRRWTAEHLNLIFYATEPYITHFPELGRFLKASAKGEASGPPPLTPPLGGQVEGGESLTPRILPWRKVNVHCQSADQAARAGGPVSTTMVVGTDTTPRPCSLIS